MRYQATAIKKVQKYKDLLSELTIHLAGNGPDFELYNTFAPDKMNNVLRDSGSDLAHHFAAPPNGSGRKLAKPAKAAQ